MIGIEKMLSNPNIPEQLKKAKFDNSKMEKLKPILKLVTFIEDKYKCQGICKAPLFFYA
jgi:hypothetical protein